MVMLAPCVLNALTVEQAVQGTSSAGIRESRTLGIRANLLGEPEGAMPKMPEWKRREVQFVIGKLGSGIICGRCQCTLDSFAEKCSASLTDECEGFKAIDAAKAEFRAGVPTGTGEPNAL